MMKPFVVLRFLGFLLASMGATSSRPVLSEEIFSSLDPSSRPFVLTVDGLDKNMQYGGLRWGVGGLLAETRDESYLRTAILEHWEGLGPSDVDYLPWSGDTRHTERVVCNAKQLIGLWSIRAKRAGRPLVVVAHSWGGVIAYHAVRDTRENRICPAFASTQGGVLVDQLVTLCTPLGKKFIDRRDGIPEMDEWIGHNEPLAAVREWRNYRVAGDSYSSEITGAKNELLRRPPSKTQHAVSTPQVRSHLETDPHTACWSDSELMVKYARDVQLSLGSPQVQWGIQSQRDERSTQGFAPRPVEQWVNPPKPMSEWTNPPRPMRQWANPPKPMRQ